MDKTLRIGFVGSGWMARAHAHAIRTIGELGCLPFVLKCDAIAGLRYESTIRVASRLGFERPMRHWEEVVFDPAVDIVAILGPTSNHFEMVLAALEAGKAVLCEKPLAPSLRECEQLAQRANRSGCLSALGYNYRFVPAITLGVELYRSGRLGEVRSFRGIYNQGWAISKEARKGWRFDDVLGGSAVGDYSHVIDLAHLFVPGFEVLSSGLLSYNAESGSTARIKSQTASEDAFVCLGMGPGSSVSLEASRIATGYKNFLFLEVTGSLGSIRWNLEDLNRLYFYDALTDKGFGGFVDILVTEPHHPYMENWWAPGHIIGWEHTFVHEWIEFIGHFAGSKVTTNPTMISSFDDGVLVAKTSEDIQKLAI
ncbi:MULTISPECIES: Gfo/Idh/MocA family oxidoreductase [Acidithrix]|uniref:Scyllo-inositol 2-dehydrogenase (NAD(+)) n=1 Tax=Acidithrix ferrooxidans TaxID=1280514 RepID=A0A0D8HE48_9ACTN|nr:MULTISPECIES: Gfo/Idh/MocA family oxidoreductase [Acidithrix]KJF16062.1 scyllo-inositol 2-dehydrogenase (NAD(+)) [Acidithrix ferrooxidans]